MTVENKHVVSKYGPVVDPFLRLYSNGEFIRSYRIVAGSTVVGRDPSASIMVNDRFVSRHHFFVEYDDKKNIFVQDLKSRNGTFVNGLRIERTRLKHGDKISFGIFEMAVSFPSAKDSVSAQTQIATEPLMATSESTIPPISKMDPSVRGSRPYGLRPIARLPPTSEAELEALPYRVIPRRKLRWTVKAFLTGCAMIFLSAFVAWNAYQWNKLRQQRIAFENQVEVKESKDAPQKGAQTTKQSRQNRKQPTKPTQESSRQHIEQKTQEAPPDVMVGLDNSLDSLFGETPDSGAMELKKNDSRKGAKTAKVIKKVIPETLTIDIKLPMTSEAKLNRIEKQVPDFDVAGYRDMLRARVFVVNDCYVEHMSDSPKRGQISVWLSIRKDGSVQKTGIESSTFKKKSFERCVIQRIKNVKVDAPPWDGFTITYTFKFEGSSKMDFS
ncbi:MAG: FHA domain-containing protein [Bdellovibrionales bacterium]|nr:FHA domain-containing protein [Bdellovibrionales bacterium]